MNIVFAAPECSPFVKTGGLADVLGSLPFFIAEQSRLFNLKKLKVIVILPKYSQISNTDFNFELIPGKLYIPVGDTIEEGSIYQLQSASSLFKSPLLENIEFYFIENKKYFNRQPIYWDLQYHDYEDNDERFVFYSRAVLECCKLINFQPQIIHCHDWQAALIPAYLKLIYNHDAFFFHTRSVLTLHNIAYQGLYSKTTLFTAGFGWNEFTFDQLEYYDHFNFLKAGLVYADKITTVSPTYSQQIQESNEWGRGMEGILRLRRADVHGILNGLDYHYWNPEKDLFIQEHYSLKLKNLSVKKEKCKEDLQKEVGMPVNRFIPIIGMVSRMDSQKGFEFVFEILIYLIQNKIRTQWIILGQGDPVIQDQLKVFAQAHPDYLSVDFKFKEPLAHKIYAGSDILLMPSKFEPCGLSQMIAMRYGTIPIVTPTGGFIDTIKPWNSIEKMGTGFISKELNSGSLIQALLQALQLRQTPEWEMLMRQAMSQVFSWENSAKKYLQLFESII